MQDIREIEFRNSGSNANNRIYFEFRTTALRPHLHTEGFPLHVYTGSSTNGPSTRNYNSTLGVPFSTLKHDHLYTREIDTKPKLNHNHLYTREIGTNLKQRPQSPLHERDRHKLKVEITNLVIIIDHKQHLVITIDHK